MEHLTERQRHEDEYFETLNFKYFDPVRDIIKANVKDSAIVLVGSRRTGKSILIRDLYYKIHKYYEDVYLFTETYETNKTFWNFIDKKNVYKGIDEAALNRIWEIQERRINESKETDKHKMPHVLLILDDIIGDNSSAKSSDFLCKVFANGRHACICVLLATQTMKKISKHVRGNADISIGFYFKNIDDKHDFVDENFSVDSRRLGCKILDSIVAQEDHTGIVCLNYLHTTDIERKITKYQASEKVPKETGKRKMIISNHIEAPYKISQSKYRFLENEMS